MDLLQSHLRGEASQLVRGLGYSGKNYVQILKELKNAFGHNIKVARAFLNTIISGPAVSSHDAYALWRFYVSIRDCVTTLQQLHYTSDLFSSDVVVKTTSRIAYDKVAWWNAHVRDVARKKEPNLIDLLHWLKDQVDVDFNLYAVPMDRTKTKSQQPCLPSEPTRRKQTTLNVSVKQPAQQNQRDSPSEKVVRKCLICSEDHLIYKCAKFLNVPVAQRLQFVEHYKLCNNCLKPNHTSDNCFSHIRCRDSNCNAKHHALLHVNTQVETIPKVTVNASSRKQCPNVADFQIVSVLVCGKNVVQFLHMRYLIPLVK